MVSQPTAKQLNYLMSLVKQAGMTQEEWRDSVGLYEVSPWGKRLRSELVTRVSVSRWIDDLRRRIDEMVDPGDSYRDLNQGYGI